MRHFRTKPPRIAAASTLLGFSLLFCAMPVEVGAAYRPDLWITSDAAPEPPPGPNDPERDSQPTSDKEIDLVPKTELDAALSRLDAVTQRLVEAYRQLFLRLPETERGAFLAELMNGGDQGNTNGHPRQPLPHQVRELAYDLATAEVVSARPLGPGLIETAARGLADERPGIRTKAAGLLSKVDANDVMEQVLLALQTESHPGAATAMLTIVARHPKPEALASALARLSPDTQSPPVVVAAIDALLALHGIGVIQQDETRAYIARAIGAIARADYTPNTVRLLAGIGQIEVVRDLLGAENLPVARAAGESLVTDLHSVDLLIEHAMRNASLFEYAAESVRRHDPTAARFAALAAIGASSTEKRDEWLVRLAAALPPAELLRVVAKPMDLAERERYLAAYATADELSRFGEAEYRTEDRRVLVESLVRTRLQLRNAAGVIRVIDAIPAEGRWELLHQEELAALLWLNRLPDALERANRLGQPTGVEVWLSTMEKIETLDHAPAALRVLEQSLAGQLTETQITKLETLRTRIAALHPEPDEPAPGGAVAETEVLGEDPYAETPAGRSGDAEVSPTPETSDL